MFPHDKLDWTITRLERHLQDAPDDVASRLEHARSCLSRAQFHDGGEVWFNRALTQARRILQADPDSPGAMVVAGLCLVGLDRLDHAARYLDEALRLEPERGDVHLSRGLLESAAGNAHQAVRALEVACRLSPESWEPHYLLGELLAARAQATGDSARLLERAQYHTVRALQLGPSATLSPRLLMNLGTSCLRAGRMEDAHKLFTRLQEFPTHRDKARYFLGLASYNLGRHQNAILYLRQHMDAVGDSAPVHAMVGMAYLSLGEVSKAREACNQALAIEPRDARARWILGCALLEEGQEAEAIRLFKEILRESPDHTGAFTELVRVRRDRGDVPWLLEALRAEVASHDGLPPLQQRNGHTLEPRAAVRERVDILLHALADFDVDHTPALLEILELTSDEALRFTVWEAALHQTAALHAAQAANWLGDPGGSFSAERGREILLTSALLPEALLIRGLQIREEDLSRAAIDRYGAMHDVAAHRDHLERERQEARAWQALLLLAVSSRATRTGRTLLVRWISDADPELADAARAALAMQGDDDAAAELRARARDRSAIAHLEALLATLESDAGVRGPRPVSDDEAARCTTCGRRVTEVSHMLAGHDAVMCDRCMMDVARHRHELAAQDPSVTCDLCGRSPAEARGLYVYRGTPVCAACLDDGLGLVEREAVAQFLAST